MPAKPDLFIYAIRLFGIWAGVVLGLCTFIFFTSHDLMLHALIGMAGGLGYGWIVGCGLLMRRFREPIRVFAQRIRLDWRLKFVLLATLLAMLEEAIATTLTNLAPRLGVPLGKVYVTASANYLDVIFFHSVIVFIPEFIAWAWLLSRFDFSPNEAFVIYGITGALGEILAFGPQNMGMLGFWVFVYGLMIYLPAYAGPSESAARKPHWQHYLLALLLPLLLAMPVVLLLTKGLHHPDIHFPPIRSK